MSEHFVQYVLRLIFALLIGGIIGLEREIKGKPAGMRTNILICMASCLLMILSLEIFRTGSWLGDPSRIASQVVVGIGFLGAGTIMRSRFNVQGLTSAATIWFVAAIGLMIGWGDFALAVAATTLIVLTLTVLGVVERWVDVKQRRHVLQFQFPAELRRFEDAKVVLRKHQIRTNNFTLRRDANRILVDIEYEAPDKKHLLVVDALRQVPDIDVLLEY